MSPLPSRIILKGQPLPETGARRAEKHCGREGRAHEPAAGPSAGMVRFHAESEVHAWKSSIKAGAFSAAALKENSKERKISVS